MKFRTFVKLREMVPCNRISPIQHAISSGHLYLTRNSTCARQTGAISHIIFLIDLPDGIAYQCWRFSLFPWQQGTLWHGRSPEAAISRRTAVWPTARPSSSAYQQGRQQARGGQIKDDSAWSIWNADGAQRQTDCRSRRQEETGLRRVGRDTGAAWRDTVGRRRT